jgi:hypothetical protein
MSLVFQNNDPPSPSSPPLLRGGEGEDTLAGRRGGGGGVNILEDEDIGLPSYSNNLSTVVFDNCC